MEYYAITANNICITFDDYQSKHTDPKNYEWTVHISYTDNNERQVIDVDFDSKKRAIRYIKKLSKKYGLVYIEEYNTGFLEKIKEIISDIKWEIKWFFIKDKV